jgi:hypothetical protein
MNQAIVAVLIGLVLVGCGGPSQADLQATVSAAVSATAQAQQVATSVAATQTAAEACGATALGAYADAVEEQIKTFEMQSALVGNTPRVSMGVPMQELLNIQTETRRMDVPECLKPFHEQVVSMMGLYRLGYENFAGQGEESMTMASLQLGEESLVTIKNDLQSLRAGTVPPTPTPAP